MSEKSGSTDALTSLDSYGHKLEIIPAEVKGRFRKGRDFSQALLILIFLFIPWTSINHSQTILIDIVHRKFSFFGVQFWSHDGPLIFFILAILTLGLALMTALWGRIWCGWGCPQTVFIDGIYRRIERLVEGNYIERRSLRKSPFTFLKMNKWILKWFLFAIVSSIIAHSFIAYFIGSTELIEMIKGGPQGHWFYFLLISAMTGILLFNFGWFREQFCIVMCPYGRFQSVLMDPNSLTILYDQKRGEPRRGTGEATGDCISCRRCVEVCPTGIDIRNGVQMECIACTSCIDACNEIMTKVKKPQNLIGYSSLHSKARLLRPRTLGYSFLLMAACIGLGFNLINRSDYIFSILRAHETPYQILTENNQATIMNHFKIHIHNQSQQSHQFSLEIPQNFIDLGVKLTLPQKDFVLEPISAKEIHFFTLAPANLFDSQGQVRMEVKIKSDADPATMEKAMVLLGPPSTGGNR
jgi:cytochrome c oxidase accessory protein FixG